MTTDPDIVLDFERRDRIGVDEAILCAGKTVPQLVDIMGQASSRGVPLLLTRLDAAVRDALPTDLRNALDYDEVSRTAVFGEPPRVSGDPRVAVVSAGSSDQSVASEAERTLAYHGHPTTRFRDVGVAGIWRMTDRLDEIREHPVVIVVAGMDGALPSVIGGLVGGLVIAVPTSTGYGAARGGETALFAALTSCAPGLVVVNIDNGYGAAVAAIRALGRGGAV